MANTKCESRHSFDGENISLGRDTNGDIDDSVWCTECYTVLGDISDFSPGHSGD